MYFGDGRDVLCIHLNFLNSHFTFIFYVSEVASWRKPVILGIDKSLYSETSHDSDSKIETPFLSNFTKRLSEMSANNLKLDYENKRDAIKEQDSNGSSSYATRTYLSRYVNVEFFFILVWLKFWIGSVTKYNLNKSFGNVE